MVSFAAAEPMLPVTVDASTLKSIAAVLGLGNGFAAMLVLL
jgi:hypothetical protein